MLTEQIVGKDLFGKAEGKEKNDFFLFSLCKCISNDHQ